MILGFGTDPAQYTVQQLAAIGQKIKQDKLDDVLSSLPESTKKFLSSEDSKEIRLKIKQGNSRH